MPKCKPSKRVSPKMQCQQSGADAAQKGRVVVPEPHHKFIRVFLHRVASMQLVIKLAVGINHGIFNFGQRE